MTQHARIHNGEVQVMLDGRWQGGEQLVRWELIHATDNPFNSPILKERARQIRAALDEVQYLQQQEAA